MQFENGMVVLAASLLCERFVWALRRGTSDEVDEEWTETSLKEDRLDLDGMGWLSLGITGGLHQRGE